MKKLFLLTLFTLMLGSLNSKPSTLTPNPSSLTPHPSPLTYVEPRIGTAHCRYFHFAPGAMPFGMAKPGPSTYGKEGNADGWQASGYDYRHTEIDGFPIVHEFQVAGISLMPCEGKAGFTHADETVQPGYYAVNLKNGIKAECTATERVAFHRFTYPESYCSKLVFDIGTRMGESGAIKDAEVHMNDDGSVEGWVYTYPEYVKAYQPEAIVPIYFYSVIDSKLNLKREHLSARGSGANIIIEFKTAAGDEVTIKTGISYTSVENAKLNLQTEAASMTFAEAQTRSQQTWEQMLGRIEVETANRADKVKFYSGLYHAILGRGLCSDVNGCYPKNDGSVGQVALSANGSPVHNVYNTDAMWGGQWNLTQLWLMAYPEHVGDFISSLLQGYKDCGWLADGLANNRFVSGVGTNQIPLLMTAAYQCGVRDFDVNLAYEACLKNELCGTDRPRGAGKADTDEFVRLGYAPQIPASDPREEYYFGASHTLEYSYTAWAVAQLAKKLNKKQDYKKLMWLSRGWERIYDDKINFMHPRLATGEFTPDFDPLRVWHGFQEGNAWQYTFYVPHDTKSLIAKVGKNEFVARLDSIFTQSQPKLFSGGQEVDAFAGLRTLYNQGNQPCLHISWLFTDAGRYDLTEKWVHAILNEFYGTDGIHGYGYGQDEDQGQLGAWYVLSSIGLFSIDGLTSPTPTFAVCPTIFDKVTIHLNPDYYQGTTFVIDGKKRPQTKRLPFATFTKGGTLK